LAPRPSWQRKRFPPGTAASKQRRCKGKDVLYGGDGDDFLDASLDGQRDKLYCGEGKDEYAADKIDYVSSSCEKKTLMGGA
jgi:hypothetical protein